MGSVFGEIAWVMKSKRGATITATSPGLLFTITGPKLSELADLNAELESRLWETCGRRVSENLLLENMEHHEGQQSRQQFRDIVHEMNLFVITPEKKRVRFNKSGHVILLRGKANILNDDFDQTELFHAPRILEIFTKSYLFSVDFSTDAKYMCHPLTISGEQEQYTRTTKISSNSSLIGFEYKRPTTYLSPSTVQQLVLLPSNNVNEEVSLNLDIEESSSEGKEFIATESRHAVGCSTSHPQDNYV